MSSTTNLPINARSMNGVLTWSDGETTYSGGEIIFADGTVLNSTSNSITSNGNNVYTGTNTYDAAVQVNSTLGCTSAATLGSLTVTGASTLAGLTAGSSTLASLNVTGASTHTGIVQINNTLGCTGVCSLTNATDSTSLGTGALVVSGGVSIADQLRVGTNTTISGTLAAGATTLNSLTVNTVTNLSGMLNVGNTSKSINLNGNPIYFQGTGGSNTNNYIQYNSTSDGVTLQGNNSVSLGTSTGAATVVNVAPTLVTIMQPTSITNTTDATSLGTGALVISGGVSIADQLRVGTNTTISGTLAVTGGTTHTGAVQINNTLGCSGLTTLTNTTDSSALGTGALVVSGGVSIADQLRVGTNTTISGTLSVTGSSTHTGAVQINNTLGCTGATTFGSTLAVSGGTTLSGATQINNTLGCTGVCSLTNTTDSSSVGTGALVVSGGVSIADQLRVGTNTTLSGALAVTGTTTNTGAVQINNTLNVTGQITGTTLSATTSITTPTGNITNINCSNISASGNATVGNLLQVNGATYCNGTFFSDTLTYSTASPVTSITASPLLNTIQTSQTVVTITCAAYTSHTINLVIPFSVYIIMNGIAGNTLGDYPQISLTPTNFILTVYGNGTLISSGATISPSYLQTVTMTTVTSTNSATSVTGYVYAGNLTVAFPTVYNSTSAYTYLVNIQPQWTISTVYGALLQGYNAGIQFNTGYTGSSIVVVPTSSGVTSSFNTLTSLPTAAGSTTMTTAFNIQPTNSIYACNSLYTNSLNVTNGFQARSTYIGSITTTQTNFYVFPNGGIYLFMMSTAGTTSDTINTVDNLCHVHLVACGGGYPGQVGPPIFGSQGDYFTLSTGTIQNAISFTQSGSSISFNYFWQKLF